MKALILAAGLGTRLLPHTHTLPKPLFTLNGRPMLDLAIDRLLDCGCDQIFINTHHLAEQLRAFVAAHPHKRYLTLVHEPQILDTGGAVANLKGALSDTDFLVVNADIVCTFDLDKLINAHKTAKAIATLLVHDYPRFNKLCVEAGSGGLGIVRHFNQDAGTGLAFTGIQAVSPEIFNHMPDASAFSSIDVYKKLAPDGRIRSLKANSLYWRDMGTPDDYRQTSREWLAGKIFTLPPAKFNEIQITRLAGDGSDRTWFRAEHGQNSLVLSDHGICLDSPETGDTLAQIRAFVNIGWHLEKTKLAAPKILGHDEISGQVALEDLGSIHLADQVAQADENGILRLYKKAIHKLIAFSQKGINGFDPAWTCQTPSYSKQMILDLECRYFMQAFANGFCGSNQAFEDFLPLFSHIADNALVYGLDGLMHRDMQSRNIMVKNDDIYFIDFQSARQGPIQYDLASLLIDPYVKLTQRIQTRLLEYALFELEKTEKIDRDNFIHSYKYCCLTRNLQMLGAFGFLSRVKNKPEFEAYIPHALNGLDIRLKELGDEQVSPLHGLVTTLLRRI